MMGFLLHNREAFFAQIWRSLFKGLFVNVAAEKYAERNY